ncbi:MAG: DUF4878 domain-containing protein [Succinivibrio sp.]|nr:DUF4878 domain-containing protein [Succinivibrio sp.]
MLLRRLLTALAGAAALVSLLAVSGCGEKPTPEAVAEEFVTAVLEGDSDKAIKMFRVSDVAKEQQMSDTDADVVKGKIKSKIEHQAEKVKAAGGYKDLKASPADYSEDKKSARVTVTYIVDGNERHERVKLSLKDDEWVPQL